MFCLSNVKRSIGTFIIFLCLLFSHSTTTGQISPGDLSEPHSHLEGMSNCTKCHNLGEKVTNDKCLDCHKVLAERISSNKGYHSSDEIAGKDCIKCHSDHHGRKFQMIRFDKDNFDHKLTGYPLEGKHQINDCSKCHNKNNITDEVILNKKSTFLGLTQNCLACHDDQHQNTLGNDCAKCHGFNDFKPATGFNHDNSDYQLKGKHREVACDKCHKQIIVNTKTIKQYKNIPHSSCVNCHTDVHNNKFGNDCARCHTEESFASIITATKFNHSLTGYELTGMHNNVSCKKCHKGKLTDPIKHTRCTDCHSDFHKGQLTTGGRVTDCIECHTTYGFAGSSYTIERHNLSSFELSGSHLATPCFICHKKNNEWQFKNIGTKCADCHTDIHVEFIHEKYYPDKTCTVCHNENRWSQIKFEHDITGYQLKGSHELVSCRKCHFMPVKNNTYEQRFKSLDDNCTTCHQDIHMGQFEPVETEIVCLDCHQYKNWQPTKFDHNETLFPLDGKHINVACNKCHNQEIKNNKKYIVYKLKDYKCEDCH